MYGTVGITVASSTWTNDWLWVRKALKEIVMCISNLEMEKESHQGNCLSIHNLQMSETDGETIIDVPSFYALTFP